MNPEGTPNGETNNGEQVTNDAPTTPTPPAPAPTIPPVDNTDWKKKAEQAEMRTRQLENEKQAREKADEAASQKQLEEQNEFKTLYEREKEAREKLETDREASDRQSSIEKAKSTILADYPKEVLDVAEVTGLSLYDDSETAQADFKSRLDALKDKVAPNTPAPKVRGNNGAPSAPSTDEEADAKLYKRMRFNDTALADAARSEALKKIPALDVMRKNAGLTVQE